MNIEELKKIKEAATAGPWRVDSRIYNSDDHGAFFCASIRPTTYLDVAKIQSSQHVEDGVSREAASSNAQLIALSPQLADRVIAAEELVKALREVFENDHTAASHSFNGVKSALYAYEAL